MACTHKIAISNTHSQELITLDSFKLDTFKSDDSLRISSFSFHLPKDTIIYREEPVLCEDSNGKLHIKQVNTQIMLVNGYVIYKNYLDSLDENCFILINIKQ